jgi:integrase
MPRSLLPVEVAEHLDSTAIKVLTDFEVTHAKLAVASKEQLLDLQCRLLMGNTWGKWQVDPKHVSGRRVRDSECTYEVRSAIPAELDPSSEIASAVWCELLRVAIAGRLWPGPKGRRTAFSTTHTNIRMLGLLTRRIALRDGEGFWSRATREEVGEWLGTTGPHYADLLGRLFDRGAIKDAPAGRTKPLGNAGPRDRTGEPEHHSHIDEQAQWQPFPDAFSAAAGRCAIKMIELVGQTLLDALEAAADVKYPTVVLDKRTSRVGKKLKYRTAAANRAAARNPVIANWDWRTANDAPLRTLPFEAEFHGKGRSGGISWPPRTYAQAMCVLSVLQTSHVWIASLSVGGRHGEIAALREGCVRREASVTPTARIHTWKLDGIPGRKHEAPLPNIVVTALRQQERLARLVKRLGGVDGDHLWTKFADGIGEPASDFRSSLHTFVATFKLQPLLDGTSPHMHRFRKTLVRMVALALVHAPKILMDILGHRDEQMTVMRYILSDPGLLHEIQETVQELVVLKGVEAIHRRDELQGKAADVLRDRVAVYAKRLGTKALEPQNVLEFARAMTEGGTGWAVIAPGILCTGFKTGGLCNKGQSDANPEYCHPGCHNQLVMPDFLEDGHKVASAVTHAMQTLDYMLSKLQEAENTGEELLVAQFAGQVKALLGRWHEVDLHYASHPVVRRHLPNVVLLP